MMVSCTRWIKVFSAHAEVVLGVGMDFAFLPRILRARGGSSDGNPSLSIDMWYSPRTRR